MTTFISMKFMHDMWERAHILTNEKRRKAFGDAISEEGIQEYVKTQLVGLVDKDQVVLVQVGNLEHGILPSMNDLERTKDFFKKAMESMNLDPKFLVVVPPTFKIKTASVADIKKVYA